MPACMTKLDGHENEGNTQEENRKMNERPEKCTRLGFRKELVRHKFECHFGCWLQQDLNGKCLGGLYCFTGCGAGYWPCNGNDFQQTMRELNINATVAAVILREPIGGNFDTFPKTEASNIPFRQISSNEEELTVRVFSSWWWKT